MSWSAFLSISLSWGEKLSLFGDRSLSSSLHTLFFHIPKQKAVPSRHGLLPKFAFQVFCLIIPSSVSSRVNRGQGIVYKIYWPVNFDLIDLTFLCRWDNRYENQYLRIDADDVNIEQRINSY